MNYYANSPRVYDLVLSPLLLPLRKAFVETAAGLKAESIADFCCGTGNQIKHFRKAGFKKLTGIDLSPDMTARAEYAVPGAEFITGDAAETSLPAQSFDLCMISMGLHENTSEKAEAIIREMGRVVKRKGCIAVGDYCHEKTASYGQRISAFIEYLAGGEHYKNYRNYINSGGLDSIMEDYHMIEERKVLAGAVFLRIYRHQ